MTVCRACLEPTGSRGAYHRKCLRRLFDAVRPPRLDIDASRLHAAALAMVGHTSLSGVQKKIALGLDGPRTALTVMAEGGTYILKPQTGVYPAIPENEHVTTRLAELVGIETAPSALIELSDGTLAFIVRRFDRLRDGRNVHQEDFCQLAEEPPKNKYEGSAELCVKLVKRFASEPLIELLKLYRLLVFSWWSGNGDMHLKNFSLLIDEVGFVRMTPAYDLVSTHLVIENDPQALTVNGKNQHLARGDWLRLADYAGIPRKAAERVLAQQVGVADAAIDLLHRSFLPEDFRRAYADLLRERSQRIR